jgi:hypothetical protein
MTKIDDDHFQHKGWRIVRQIVPDGWLYCLWSPNSRDDDQYIWATDTLKEARDFIDDQGDWGRNIIEFPR